MRSQLLVAGLLALWSPFLFATKSSANDQQPNVLLIITDEHNFRTLGCYRETMSREQSNMWGIGAVVPTPHLDALAKDGVLCTRAYATSPVCSPCRAALFTGRYPHATGVPENDAVLDRSVPTLADRLNDVGYRTAYIGKWHLGGTGKPEWSPKVDGGFQFKKFMFNRGHWKKFAIEDGIPSVATRKNGNARAGAREADEESFATDWLTDRAIEYITDESATQPFFTVVSYPDPHGPNAVRSPYDHMFDDLPFAPPRTYQTGQPKPKWVAEKNHAAFRGADMSIYYGMVKCIDDNIGRLVERLKEANQFDNTLIIMTSDHGDLCYEHDRQNKGNPYEGSARIPMILRFPERIQAGQYYTRPIGTVDMTPTIMGLLNRPANLEDHGRNLSNELADVSTINESDSDEPVTFLRIGGKSARWVAAVDRRYKLVLSVNDVPWLFDAQRDPDELQNLYGRPDTHKVSKRLAKSLREYGTATNDPHLQNDRIAESLSRILDEDQ
ncbi:sulfatase family protein [Rhodopirellula sallentina]|uniref:Sulfatase family protein n=1 Tax=Rhodopirellula sallentina SM41 TaxID=1263870 RepID=M5TRZ2_9BACT|nr:sulfatase [Rhodopirellula sallentina]EMI51957.1 sulfatase family protein [Rhodopirellula sallentina SM41]